jgi:hypothetical protein
MILDQNRIELQTSNGVYDEYKIAAGETGNILPGAMLVLKECEAQTGSPVLGNGDAEAQLFTQATDLDSSVFAILLENALLGRTINHKARVGEVNPVRRPVTGDVYQLRATPGEYKVGDAVFAVQTTNGVYVGKTGTKLIGYAEETYSVSATPTAYTDAELDAINGTAKTSRPKRNTSYDQVDDSNSDFPSTIKLNGVLVNLLRVRIA